jgi:hypothetical protein
VIVRPESSQTSGKRLGIPQAAVGQPRFLEQVIHDRPDLLRRHVAGVGAQMEVAALGLEIAELAQETACRARSGPPPSSRVRGRGWY